MSAGTHIEWTDATWNPVTGCTRVSSGCDHCYAAAMTHRLAGMGRSLKITPQQRAQAERYIGLTVENAKGDRHFNGKVRCHEELLDLPLHWKKPRRIFVNSMSDLFHKDVPFGFVLRILCIIANTPRHTYQILTKRPERAMEFVRLWNDLAGEDFANPKLVPGPEKTRQAHPSGRGQLFADMLETMGPPPPGAAYPTFDWMEGMIAWPAFKYFHNVWLGTSCEDEATLDERLPHILRCPAAVRFLSLEPLLGPIDLSSCLSASVPQCPLHWVIVGGESGPGARPMHPDWVRSIRDQCVAAGVPFFFKQWGHWLPNQRPFRDHLHWVHKAQTWVRGGTCLDLTGKVLRNGKDFEGASYPVAIMRPVGKKAAGHLLDGQEWRQYPGEQTVSG